MKIFTLGVKKQDKAPIFPMFVCDLQDKNLAKKKKACKAICDFIGYIIYPVIFFLIGVFLGKMLIQYKADSQIERHNNNLVRFVNSLQKDHGILYNSINDVMTKISNLTENHNNTKEELLVLEYFINDLAKDLQTLKDSVKHIEEEKHHSDVDDIVLDGDENSDYPYPSSVIYPENQPTTEVTLTLSQSVENFEDSVTNHRQHINSTNLNESKEAYFKALIYAL